jgi:hypothetical protein
MFTLNSSLLQYYFRPTNGQHFLQTGAFTKFQQRLESTPKCSEGIIVHRCAKIRLPPGVQRLSTKGTRPVSAASAKNIAFYTSWETWPQDFRWEKMATILRP